MATESIRLPGELIVKVNEAAAIEGISPEELVQVAVEARLNRDEWRKAVDFGERNSRSRGLKPEDVEEEIAASRAERLR